MPTARKGGAKSSPSADQMAWLDEEIRLSKKYGFLTLGQTKELLESYEKVLGDIVEAIKNDANIPISLIHTLATRALSLRKVMKANNTKSRKKAGK
jgi:hypothetical protein